MTSAARSSRRMSCWSRASRPTTLTRKRLQDHVKATIAPYKYPRSVKFVDRAAEDADRQDPAVPAEERSNDRLSPRRARFSTCRTASIYLDGNSLGPLPIAAKARVADMLDDEWGKQLIRGWNSAGWMMQPRRIGDRIGRLIGAPEGTSSWATRCRSRSTRRWPRRSSSTRRAASCSPTAAISPPISIWRRGCSARSGAGYELKVVEPEEVEAAIDDSVAVLMLTEVDYRTGRLHDMKALTAKAHARAR